MGNVTLGGSGKTTIAAWLGLNLIHQGYSVAIISKGYGRRSSLPTPTRAKPNATRFGDEPAMLCWLYPQLAVWVCDDRLLALQTIEADYLICDDGLQDYRFSPRFEVGLIDGFSGFANNKIFPQGILREPKQRLTQCHIVLQQGGKRVLPPAKGRFTLSITGFTHLMTGTRLTLQQARDAWAQQPLHLCAGLANNQRLFAAFDALGFTSHKHPFADHHPFVASDIDFEGVVVLTAKDAIKCIPFANERCWRIDTHVAMPRTLAHTVMENITNYKVPHP